jgi:hypothetical protein
MASGRKNFQKSERGIKVEGKGAKGNDRLDLEKRRE